MPAASTRPGVILHFTALICHVTSCSFPPMTLTPLQLTDYRSSFSFELAARIIGGLFGGDSVTVQVHVADPFNSNTWCRHHVLLCCERYAHIFSRNVARHHHSIEVSICPSSSIRGVRLVIAPAASRKSAEVVIPPRLSLGAAAAPCRPPMSASMSLQEVTVPPPAFVV